MGAGKPGSTTLGEHFAARTQLQVADGTLDRVSGPSLPRTVRRHRRRSRVRLRQAGLVLGIGVALLPATLRSGSTAPGLASERPATSAAVPSGGHVVEATEPVVATTVAFAAFEEVGLAPPSDDVRLVAFHEASFDDALPMAPIGTLQANDNTTKFTPPANVAGFGYVVLSSRGRPTPATSAADLALPPGSAVRSLVDGTVASVTPYLLYGRYQDHRIELVPDARPDLTVVLIHVTDVQVAVGQRVEAGRTVIAGSANHFPFPSHVDRYVAGESGPHVHVEVKATSAGSPGATG